MRKIVRILKSKDADMGIGAMIVFIAMVLVAGIAASVLIQTANKLENQAMVTGQQTTNEVATGIGVEKIDGQKGTMVVRAVTYRNKIMNLTISISPRSGSNGIDLSTTVVEVSNSTTKVVLTYDSACYNYNPAPAGIFNTTASFGMAASKFGLIRIEDADGSVTSTSPVINRGDHVLITVGGNSLCGFAERTDVWGMVIPEDGAPGIFAFRTPSSYPHTIYELY